MTMVVNDNADDYDNYDVLTAIMTKIVHVGTSGD